MKTLASSLALAAGLLTAPALAQDAAPTPAATDAYVAEVSRDFLDFGIFAGQVAWINATYITDDTDAVNARVGGEFTEKSVRAAKGAARFDKTAGLSFDTRRQLDILKQGVTLPAPETPGAAKELNEKVTKLSSIYGKGKGTLQGQPINGSDIEAKMGDTFDPALTKEMWQSWHENVGRPMRADYTRITEITNAGAKELGYPDAGAMWRSGYDMDPAAFEQMMDRLWLQVKPLYDEVHCYTRTKLNAKYGDAVQGKSGPIRSDLLGNMWAQSWGNIYSVVAPAGAGDIGYDIGALLKARGDDPVKMVKIGEGFYSSLGFAPLPQTFWERSQIVKPRDREVICHASAWNLDYKDDLRIKMCTKVESDDFVTIHHELGHNYYQRAYNTQPLLYQNGANDGFHEAIGDFIALSITPEYLVQIGLLDKAKVPSADKDVGLLLRQAMDKVPGVPWTLMVDKWRWGVFSGKITPANYQKAWDDLRLQYQGIVPPVARSEQDFDPGAKYHIAAGVPYARYFLARILQFQFYKAACDMAGWKGPLHRCSFYGNKQVGERLNAMLKMGASRPWPEALAAFTGKRDMDGTAMVAYFKPLMTWLKVQNKGQSCGW